MASTTDTNSSASSTGFFAALKHPQYRRLWYAAFLLNHAQWIYTLALAWLVLELTGSAWLVGLIGFFRMAPMPVLGMAAGMVADRADWKRVVVGAQAASLAAILLLLALMAADVVQVWHICALMLVMGVAWTLDIPSRSAMEMEMVGPARVTNAMIMDTTSFSISKVVGPASAGVLLGLVGTTGAVAAATALYLAGFAILLTVGAPEHRRVARREPALRMLRQGLAYALGDQVVLGVILVSIIMNLLLFPYVQMVPVFARDVLKVSPTLMGVLASADGVGSLVGVLLLASRGDLRGPGRVFGLGSALAMAFVLVFAVSNTYGLSLAALALAGMAGSGFGAMQFALVLRATPEAVRGRAMGVLMMAIGAGPIGLLVTGALAETWGAPLAVAVNVAVGLALMAGVIIWLPALRRRDTFPLPGRAVAAEGEAAATGRRLEV